MRPKCGSGGTVPDKECASGDGPRPGHANCMQVYRDLRVLTARPTPDEERLVPHRLYGHDQPGRPVETPASGRDVQDAELGESGGFASANSTVTTFGRISSFRAARRMRLAAKINFLILNCNRK